MRKAVLLLFCFVLAFGAAAYAVGEKPGEVGAPSVSLAGSGWTVTGDPRVRDTIKVTIRVSGGTTGCDMYTIVLFTGDDREHPIAGDIAYGLRAGATRTHTLYVPVIHNPSATYRITGFVHFGTEAQVPIRDISISDASLHTGIYMRFMPTAISPMSR
jgi:hypothetical protein